MKINLKKISCPICKNPALEVSEINPDIDPISDEKTIEKYWSGFHKDNVFFPYHRCSCGFLFNKKFPDNESLQILYSDEKDNVIHGDLELDLKTKKNYLSKLNFSITDLDRNYNILEIGADNGNFLKLLKKIYKNSDLYAIEPNLNMKKDLSQVTKNVFNSVDEISINQKFDIIIGIHVFDHIPNLNEYFNKLNEHLNPSGFIFGVVHDEKSLMPRILKHRWPIFRLQHPHLFNHISLNNFLSKYNFNKIFIKKTKNFFNIGYLINQLFLSLFKLKIKMPNLFSVGLKLGNFSFLYQKK